MVTLGKEWDCGGLIAAVVIISMLTVGNGSDGRGAGVSLACEGWYGEAVGWCGDEMVFSYRGCNVGGLC